MKIVPRNPIIPRENQPPALLILFAADETTAGIYIERGLVVDELGVKGEVSAESGGEFGIGGGELSEPAKQWKKLLVLNHVLQCKIYI